MTTVFIRHNLKEDEIIETLWNEKKIGVIFDHTRSLNEKDYDEGTPRDSIRRFKKYCEDGAIVGASYRNHGSTMLVGRLKPNTEIERRRFRRYTKERQYTWVKCAQLVDVREVSFIQYPVLFSTRPRGVTLWGWGSMTKQLECAIKGTSLPEEVNSLSYGQMEVLCYEYMLKHESISHLLLPIGRGLPDIDIFGFDKSSNYVAGQVTFEEVEKKMMAKINRLLAYNATNMRLFFFGKIMRPESIPDGVEYEKLSNVFDDLLNNPKSTEIVRRMLSTRDLYVPDSAIEA